MNKANTKIIALLLVIPLLLIFTMTSVVKTTTLAVDIPVSSVEIKGEDIIDIDLAEDNNAYKIETEITPKNATNQNILLEASAIEGKTEAQVKIAEDGTVTALSLGSAKITAYAGGRTDSIQINFTSSLANDVEEAQKNVDINVGESIDLTDADYLSKKGNLTGMTWESDNPDVVKVNDLGKIRGEKEGVATVTGTVQGLSIDATTGAVNRAHEYIVSYAVTVESTTDDAGFTFLNCAPKDGKYVLPTMSTATFDFTCEKEKLAEYGELRTYFEDSQIASVSEITQKPDGSFTFDVKLKSTAKMNERYEVQIWSTNALSRSAGAGSHIATVYVQKGYWTYAELDHSQTAMKLGDSSLNILDFYTDVSKEYESYLSVEYRSTKPDVLSIENVGKRCRLTAKSLGEAELYAVVSLEFLGQSYETEKITMQVVDPVTSISFAEANDKTIENIYTIAGNEVSFDSTTGYDYYKNGIATPTTYTLKASAKKHSGGAVEEDDIVWVSSNEAIATVENGVVTIVGGQTEQDKKVKFTAYGKYNQALKDDRAYAEVTLKCIEDGVWVDDYYDLMYATEKKVPTVLREDVMLAPLLGDTGFVDYSNYLRNYATKTMRTTADATYYIDNGAEDAAVIRYAVSFTEDVYGNGHVIDAEYITTAQKRTGDSVYNGPLDLVRLDYSNLSKQNAAVKAQDNIVFLVDTAGVTLSNVELKGCSDSSLNDADGTANLSNFDNIGTVLEIVADDCKLEYSRVNNGRTVVRVFGSRYEADESKIEANRDAYRVRTTISKCILERGREFILKISSNQVKKNPSPANSTVPENLTEQQTQALYDDASPFFTKADGTAYGRESIGKANDEYFYDHYVMTDIVLQDTVFSTAGLFCIGFESRFAGLCLHGYDFSVGWQFSQLGWGRVAGTSYPARLQMKGDVRFYDWKEVSKINSETLIEVEDGSLFQALGFNMDVSKLITQYSNANPDKNLISKEENKDWVNGAIAFYGGGKNYSYVDESGVGANYTRLSSYNIPLSLLGGMNILPLAAGVEDFRFNLYDSQSSFTVSRQRNELKDGTAYTWVYAK